MTGILAGTEWHPATNPQDATQTAREARDLAVRLRPVLSKLAQAPRGGRRRDLEWLPAVEQLAVDAQYFASWWLPRLEGKSAGSWPSWSADGYADWVKRLDAQRLRTLEMVEGTAPVTRIASVTQLRRGKGTTAGPDAETTSASQSQSEPASTPVPPPGAEDFAEPHSPARHARGDGDPAEDFGEEHTARITPLRGPGAALMDAALMEMSGAPEAPGMRTEPTDPSLSADETHISRATPITAAGTDTGAEDAITGGDRTDRVGGGFAESTAPTTPDAAELSISGTEDALPSVPRTPPNQGPEYDDPDTTHISRAPADRVPLGFDDLAANASDAADAAVVPDAAMPLVPRTPPNQGPDDAHVGADIVQIPRTPPNSGPMDAELSRTPLNAGPAAPDRPRGPRAPVVSLVGDDDLPRVPRTPPNPGPRPSPGPGPGPGAGPGPIGAGAGTGAGAIGTDAGTGSIAARSNAGPRAGSNGGNLSADTDADSTHVSLASSGPAALGTGAGVGAGARPGAGTPPDESTRPLFRSEAKAPAPSSTGAATAAAIAGAAVGAGAVGAAAMGSSAVSSSAMGSSAMGSSAMGSGAMGSSAMGSGAVASGGGGHDEFEHFQPGSDMPPVFPMTEPVEPVDRGRIVRYALTAVVVAVCCVAAFVALSGKSSGNKTAAAATSPSTSAVPPSTSDSSSSVDPGAVTAPTSTDTPPPVSSTASKPPVIPPKPNPPASSAPTTAAPSHTSAAPPPPVQTSHQQPPPPSGGVSSLSVSSLSADQSGGFNYVAHVHVTTRGTGSVTVTVTFAGSASGDSPGSVGAQSQSFTLSGKTSYDLDPGVDVHGVCSAGSAPYIDAVASASGADSSVAYASSPC